MPDERAELESNALTWDTEAQSGYGLNSLSEAVSDDNSSRIAAKQVSDDPHRDIRTNEINHKENEESILHN